eukprot:4644636-Pyramimonas_sp.AAC.1
MGCEAMRSNAKPSTAMQSISRAMQSNAKQCKAMQSNAETGGDEPAGGDGRRRAVISRPRRHRGPVQMAATDGGVERRRA